MQSADSRFIVESATYTHTFTQITFPISPLSFGSKEAQQAKGKSNTRALIEMCLVKVEKRREPDFHCGIQANRKGQLK